MPQPHQKLQIVPFFISFICEVAKFSLNASQQEVPVMLECLMAAMAALLMVTAIHKVKDVLLKRNELLAPTALKCQNLLLGNGNWANKEGLKKSREFSLTKGGGLPQFPTYFIYNFSKEWVKGCFLKVFFLCAFRGQNNP